MTTDLDTNSDAMDGNLRARVITGLVMAVFLVGWLGIFKGGWALGLLALISAIMVTELFLMFAHQRYLYAVGVAVLTAAGVWFSGRDALGVSLGFLIAVLVIGWIVAPPSWRVIFPVYVLVIAIGGLSAFWVRDPGFLFSIWPALVAVGAAIGAWAGGRYLGLTGSAGQSAAGLALAGIAGAILGPLTGAPHSFFFYLVASVILAAAALAGGAIEAGVKERAGVVWASDILPGYGGLLDLFKGMIITFALANIGLETGLI